MPSYHIIVKGQVQGVFYRANAKKIADNLGITGWIKNTRQGNVEITATGNGDSLDMLINWCKKGSEKSIVEEVIADEVPEKHFDTFSIER